MKSCINKIQQLDDGYFLLAQKPVAAYIPAKDYNVSIVDHFAKIRAESPITRNICLQTLVHQKIYKIKTT
jgi:hypothetical protein